MAPVFEIQSDGDLAANHHFLLLPAEEVEDKARQLKVPFLCAVRSVRNRYKTKMAPDNKKTRNNSGMEPPLHRDNHRVEIKTCFYV